jgi:hypothetical protein
MVPNARIRANERGSSRQRVGEKGEAQVAACEALGHDAGTHDGHQQKARSKEFCGDAGAEVEVHCRPMFSISFLSASRIPLPDNSVDVIISNCVINLSAD